MMNNLNLDKYLNIVNNEKIKKGLTNYIPLYPMLRVENEKLYVGIILTEEKDNVWSKEEHIKPEYWVLIDIDEDKIVEFNKTEDKDFVFVLKVQKEEYTAPLIAYFFLKTIFIKFRYFPPPASIYFLSPTAYSFILFQAIGPNLTFNERNLLFFKTSHVSVKKI